MFNNGGATDLRKINQPVLVPRSFNPFTETPVRGVNWNPGPSFGQAVDRFSYTTPRTYRFNLGVRF